ncbi:(deoxy)nucleoside triphosphate pyrophosphohydrolase [Helicovermis profundi]|uniref:8-oxo-dGTP diphosphatase n=1 Tax=Helicovermis profundi TaxID=3065157 RepID=A0AAU9E0P7_9FIRM|nr:(deoxy)nucleoside triphosphate pyrophosphohydrolase [Clostridia bacterium S502]
MKHLTVTAAILVNNNEILCMQRSFNKYDYISYKFEFPGGKVEKNETFENSLSRELKEEMNLDIDVKKDQFYETINHKYPDFSITMHSYMIYIDKREFELKEHKSFVWLKKEELLTLDWAEADIPIVNMLIRGEKQWQ